MLRFLRHPWAWTSLAPAACAVHCVATPLVVVAVPAFQPLESVEWALLGLTAILVSVAGTAGVQNHGRSAPVLILLLGLGIWTLSLAGAFHPVPEDVTTVAAALTVATGLLWNSRLHCTASEKACPACASDPAAASEARSACDPAAFPSTERAPI
jgi:hypothetical protein